MTTLAACAVRVALSVLLLSTCVALGSCSRPEPRSNQTDQYKSVYGARDNSPAERGTIRGDFQWAAAAPTLAVAASRWEEFLRTHNPPGREFEDSMHASYASAAQYELIRVYYLQGRRDDGDALLRKVDPVGWAK